MGFETVWRPCSFVDAPKAVELGLSPRALGLPSPFLCPRVLCRQREGRRTDRVVGSSARHQPQSMALSCWPVFLLRGWDVFSGLVETRKEGRNSRTVSVRLGAGQGPGCDRPRWPLLCAPECRKPACHVLACVMDGAQEELGLQTERGLCASILSPPPCLQSGHSATALITSLKNRSQGTR